MDISPPIKEKSDIPFLPCRAISIDRNVLIAYGLRDSCQTVSFAATMNIEVHRQAFIRAHFASLNAEVFLQVGAFQMCQPARCTSCTAECPVAKQMNRGCTHLLHLSRPGENGKISHRIANTPFTELTTVLPNAAQGTAKMSAVTL